MFPHWQDWRAIFENCQNPFQSILHAYLICQEHEQDLIVQHKLYPALNEQFEERSKAYYARLITTNGKAPGHTLIANTFEGSLINVAAFLWASSKYVRLKQLSTWPFQPIILTPSQKFPQDRYLMALVSNLIATAGPRVPKTNDQLACSVDRYLRGIRFTPLSASKQQVRVDHRTIPHATMEGLHQLKAAKDLRVEIGHLGDSAILEMGTAPGFSNQAARIFVKGIENEQEEIDRLTSLLKTCAASQVHILVLPELRVSPAMRAVIQEFLRGQPMDSVLNGRALLLVAAGSWHVAEHPAYRNECVLFDARGTEVWVHNKLDGFENLSDDSRECHPFGSDPQKESVEFNLPGCVLEFSDTPIGRISVAICLGFFSKRASEALSFIQAELILVPAMSKSTRPMKYLASEILVRQGAATFLANCGVKGKGEIGSSFYQLPWVNRRPKLPENGRLMFDLRNSSMYITDKGE